MPWDSVLASGLTGSSPVAVGVGGGVGDGLIDDAKTGNNTPHRAPTISQRLSDILENYFLHSGLESVHNGVAKAPSVATPPPPLVPALLPSVTISVFSEDRKRVGENTGVMMQRHRLLSSRLFANYHGFRLTDATSHHSNSSMDDDVDDWGDCGTNSDPLSSSSQICLRPPTQYAHSFRELESLIELSLRTATSSIGRGTHSNKHNLDSTIPSASDDVIHFRDPTTNLGRHAMPSGSGVATSGSTAAAVGVIADGHKIHRVLLHAFRVLREREDVILLAWLIRTVLPWHYCEVHVRVTAYFNTLYDCLPLEDPETLALIFTTFAELRTVEDVSTGILHDMATEMVRCALEWLFLDAQTDRRVTALLTIQHLISLGPKCTALLSVHMQEFMVGLWNPLKDPQPRIREMAATTLELLLEVVLDREEVEALEMSMIQQMIKKACKLLCGQAAVANPPTLTAALSTSQLSLQGPQSNVGQGSSNSHLSSRLPAASSSGSILPDDLETMSTAESISSSVSSSPFTESDSSVHAGSLAIGALVCAEHRVRERRRADQANALNQHSAGGGHAAGANHEPMTAIDSGDQEELEGVGSTARTTEVVGNGSDSDFHDESFALRSFDTAAVVLQDGVPVQVGEEDPASPQHIPNHQDGGDPLPQTTNWTLIDVTDYEYILSAALTPRRSSYRLYSERLLPLLALHDLDRFATFADSALTALVGHAFALREMNPAGDRYSPERLHADRSIAMLNIGLLIYALGPMTADVAAIFEQNLTPLLTSYLLPASRCRVDAASTTLALIVDVMDDATRREHLGTLQTLLRHSLSSSLTREVAAAAVHMHRSCPLLRPTAQAGILQLVTQVLITFALPPPMGGVGGGDGSESLFYEARVVRETFTNDAVDHSLIESKVTALIVLQKLGLMKWRGAATFFVRYCSPYLYHPEARVRRACIKACVPLLLRDCRHDDDDDGDNDDGDNDQEELQEYSTNSGLDFSSHHQHQHHDQSNEDFDGDFLALPEESEWQCSRRRYGEGAQVLSSSSAAPVGAASVAATTAHTVNGTSKSNLDQQQAIEHHGRHHVALVRQVVHAVLSVAVADPLADLRLTALKSLRPDLDWFIYPHDMPLACLFEVLNDEELVNRLAALHVLRRLIVHSPSNIIPTLRNIFVNNLSDAFICATHQLQLEERLRFILELAKLIPRHIAMYVTQSLVMLQQILVRNDVSVDASITALEMIEFLLEDANEEQWTSFLRLFSVVLRHALDLQSEEKMRTAMNTLQGITKCVSTVNTAAARGITDAQLQETVVRLQSLLLQRTSPLSPATSIALMKLLGALAAIEPLQPEPFMQATTGVGAQMERWNRGGWNMMPGGYGMTDGGGRGGGGAVAATCDLDDAYFICDGIAGWPFEILHYLLHVLSGGAVPLNEDDYCLTINAVMNVFRSAHANSTVVAEHLSSFLGPFLSIIEQLLLNNATAGSHVRRTAFSAIATVFLTPYISRTAYSQSATIIRLVRRHWDTSQPTLIYSLCEILIALNKHATEPLQDDVAWFISTLLVALLQSAEHASHTQLTLKLLCTIESFKGASTSNMLLLIIPSLCQVLSLIELPDEVRRDTARTLVRFIFACDVDMYVVRIVDCCVAQLKQCEKLYAQRVKHIKTLTTAILNTKDAKKRAVMEQDLQAVLDDLDKVNRGLNSTSLSRIEVRYGAIGHSEVKLFPLPYADLQGSSTGDDNTPVRHQSSLEDAESRSTTNNGRSNNSNTLYGASGRPMYATTAADVIHGTCEVTPWQQLWEAEVVAAICAAAGRCQSFDQYHVPMADHLASRFGTRSHVLRFFNSCANPSSEVRLKSAVPSLPSLATKYQRTAPPVDQDALHSSQRSPSTVGRSPEEYVIPASAMLSNNSMTYSETPRGIITALVSAGRGGVPIQVQYLTPVAQYPPSTLDVGARHNSFTLTRSFGAAGGAARHSPGEQHATSSLMGEEDRTPLTSGPLNPAAAGFPRSFTQSPTSSIASPEKNSKMQQQQLNAHLASSAPVATSQGQQPHKSTNTTVKCSEKIQVAVRHHSSLESLASPPTMSLRQGMEYRISSSAHDFTSATTTTEDAIPALGGAAALLSNDSTLPAAFASTTINDAQALFEQHSKNKAPDWSVWFEQLSAMLVQHSRHSYVNACASLARRHYVIACACFPWAFLSNLIMCNPQEREDWLSMLEEFERRHRGESGNVIPPEIMNEMTRLAHLIRRDAVHLFPNDPFVAERFISNETVVRLAQRALHIPIAILYLEKDILERERWEFAPHLFELYEHANLGEDARGLSFQPKLREFVARQGPGRVKPQLLEVLGETDAALAAYRIGAYKRKSNSANNLQLVAPSDAGPNAGPPPPLVSGTIGKRVISPVYTPSPKLVANPLSAPYTGMLLIPLAVARGSTAHLTARAGSSSGAPSPQPTGVASPVISTREETRQRVTNISVIAAPCTFPDALSIADTLRAYNRVCDFHSTLEQFKAVMQSNVFHWDIGVPQRTSVGGGGPVPSGAMASRARRRAVHVPVDIARQVAIAAHCLGDWSMVLEVSADLAGGSGAVRSSGVRYASFSSDGGVPYVSKDPVSKELLLLYAASEMAHGAFSKGFEALQRLRTMLVDASSVFQVASVKRRLDHSIMFQTMSELEEAANVFVLSQSSQQGGGVAGSSQGAGGGDGTNSGSGVAATLQQGASSPIMSLHAETTGEDSASLFSGVRGTLSISSENRLAFIGARPLPLSSSVAHRFQSLGFRSSVIPLGRQLRNLLCLSEQLVQEGFVPAALEHLGDALRYHPSPAAAVSCARDLGPWEMQLLHMEWVKIEILAAGGVSARLADVHLDIANAIRDVVDDAYQQCGIHVDHLRQQPHGNVAVGIVNDNVAFELPTLEYLVELLVLDMDVKRRMLGFHVFPSVRRAGMPVPSPTYNVTATTQIGIGGCCSRTGSIRSRQLSSHGGQQQQQRRSSFAAGFNIPSPMAAASTLPSPVFGHIRGHTETASDRRDIGVFVNLLEDMQHTLTLHRGINEAPFASSWKEFSLMYFDLCKAMRAEYSETNEVDTLQNYYTNAKQAVVALQKATAMVSRASELTLTSPEAFLTASSASSPNNNSSTAGAAALSNIGSPASAAASTSVLNAVSVAAAAAAASASAGSMGQTTAATSTTRAANASVFGSFLYTSRRRIAAARLNVSTSDLLLKTLNLAWNSQTLDDLNFSPDTIPTWALVSPFLAHLATRNKAIETGVIHMCQQSLAMLSQMSFHLIACYDDAGLKTLSSVHAATTTAAAITAEAAQRAMGASITSISAVFAAAVDTATTGGVATVGASSQDAKARLHALLAPHVPLETWWVSQTSPQCTSMESPPITAITLPSVMDNNSNGGHLLPGALTHAARHRESSPVVVEDSGETLQGIADVSVTSLGDSRMMEDEYFSGGGDLMGDDRPPSMPPPAMVASTEVGPNIARVSLSSLMPPPPPPPSIARRVASISPAAHHRPTDATTTNGDQQGPPSRTVSYSFLSSAAAKRSSSYARSSAPPVARHHDVIIKLAKTSPQHRAVIHAALRFVRWTAMADENNNTVSFTTLSTSDPGRMGGRRSSRRRSSSMSAWLEGISGCPLLLPSWHIRAQFLKPVSSRLTIHAARRLTVSQPAPPFDKEDIIWIYLSDGVRIKFHSGLTAKENGGPHGERPSSSNITAVKDDLKNENSDTMVPSSARGLPRSSSNVKFGSDVGNPSTMSTKHHHHRNEPAAGAMPREQEVQCSACRCHDLITLPPEAFPFDVLMSDAPQSSSLLSPSLPLAIMEACCYSILEQLPFLHLRRPLILPTSSVNHLTQLVQVVKQPVHANAVGGSSITSTATEGATRVGAGTECRPKYAPLRGVSMPSLFHLIDAYDTHRESDIARRQVYHQQARRQDQTDQPSSPLRQNTSAVTSPSKQQQQQQHSVDDLKKLHTIDGSSAPPAAGGAGAGVSNSSPSFQRAAFRLQYHGKRSRIADQFDGALPGPDDSGEVTLSVNRMFASHANYRRKTRVDAFRDTEGSQVPTAQDRNLGDNILSDDDDDTGLDNIVSSDDEEEEDSEQDEREANIADERRRRVKHLRQHRSMFELDLHKIFLMEASDPASWLETRTSFARQLAEWSVVEYVFDVSCRCAAFFAIDVNSGSVTMLQLGSHALRPRSALLADANKRRNGASVDNGSSSLATRDPVVFRLTTCMQRALPLQSPYSGFLLYAAECLQHLHSVKKELSGVLEYGLEAIRVQRRGSNSFRRRTATLPPGLVQYSAVSGGVSPSHPSLGFELLPSEQPATRKSAGHMPPRSSSVIRDSQDTLSSLATSRRKSLETPSMAPSRRGSTFVPHQQPGSDTLWHNDNHTNQHLDIVPMLQLVPTHGGGSPLPEDDNMMMAGHEFQADQEDCPPPPAPEADEEGYPIACFDCTSAIARLNEMLQPSVRRHTAFGTTSAVDSGGAVPFSMAADEDESHRHHHFHSFPAASACGSTRHASHHTLSLDSLDDIVGHVRLDAATRIQVAYRRHQARKSCAKALRMLLPHRYPSKVVVHLQRPPPLPVRPNHQQLLHQQQQRGSGHSPYDVCSFSASRDKAPVMESPSMTFRTNLGGEGTLMGGVDEMRLPAAAGGSGGALGSSSQRPSPSSAAAVVDKQSRCAAAPPASSSPAAANAPTVVPGVHYRPVKTFHERVASLIEAAMDENNIVGRDWSKCPHPWLAWAPHW